MSLISGPLSGLRSGVRSGVNPSLSGPASLWTLDATSGKGVPANATEWNAVRAAAGLGAGAPMSLYLLQEASGNPADTLGGKMLTKSPSSVVTYQNAVAGWARKGIHTTEDVEGMFSNSTFGDVNATSYLVILYALVSGPAGTAATLFRIGTTFNDDACVEINTTPRTSIGEGDTTRSAGTNNPSGAVRPFVLRVNDTANLVDGFTDQEKIVGGAQACNGTTFTLGGDFNQTNYPPTADYLYCAVFTGAAAELSDAQVKALLQALGWTIPW